MFGKEIIGPNDLVRNDIDAVLISSHRFVSEIEDAISARYGGTVQVASCYE